MKDRYEHNVSREGQRAEPRLPNEACSERSGYLPWCEDPRAA